MGLTDLLRERPIVQAPMAGGAATPELVAAVTEAGGTGFLAAGYLGPDTLATRIRAVRDSGVAAFGVNVFVPGPICAPDAPAPYMPLLETEAKRYEVSVGEPVHDDDAWDAKIDLLAEAAVPVVSFTFGCPEAGVLERLRRVGSATVVTVTTVEEARLAVERGADGVCAQGVEAGGHRGSFAATGDEHGNRSADRSLWELLPDVVDAVDVPVIATGGLMTGADVAGVLQRGAAAAQIGTAFLRCHESGAHPEHKAALADPSYTETTLTRAFTGRLARGLVNRFVSEHPEAPRAYPEIHHMTKPLRAAAAQAGDPDGMALWAGTGFRKAMDAPAAEIMERLRHEAGEAGVRV
ncbi:nitronate monooxygenase [Nocardiopsis arvandica]|uniref:Probable nitronate monooxygenase n=1 Tax=Nocardiopsis sinuspersici TaxID=501010 RepID=A0A7Z0BJL2_9ACTN|nr:nitronate monooxygenase [Nocardiopsis sinuspersici]NYH52200.1 nitronate monooxygenase [Nocardiopsis sinuspersici]